MLLKHPAFASLIFLTATAQLCFAAPVEYRGLCEASGGAFVDPSHFAMASDETNRLQLYEFGNADPIGDGVDFEGFTGFDKSDIEGAAAVGNRIYWISSHSFNSDGEDKKKRKILFATDVASGPTLVGVGTPSLKLRDPLVAATGVAKEELNIEGLTATADGHLLIGLRAPLGTAKAIVIALENPAEVIEAGAEPKFGTPIPLKLDGLGIRSLDRVGDGERQYLIAAGPLDDSTAGIALYWWSGAGDPAKIDNFSFDDQPNFKPEAVAAIPGTTTVAIFSDDGDDATCSDETTPPAQRKFRGIVFETETN